jgi:hypothetical protein
MPSQPSLLASPCRKWLLADLDGLLAQIYSYERERLLWQSRFPAVNADRGKLLSYGYPAVKILARLYLPGSLLCKSQSVSPNRDVRARIMRFLYCPQVPMRVRVFATRRQSCRAARLDVRPSGAFLAFGASDRSDAPVTLSRVIRRIAKSEE